MLLSRIAGLLRTVVLGGLFALLLAVPGVAGLLLARPDPSVVATGPYLLIGSGCLAALLSLGFGTLLSVRVLTGLRPLRAAPEEITRAVHRAAAGAGVRPPTCWAIERRLDRPVVLRGLRTSHLVISPAQFAGSPRELARDTLRELADGSARLTLFGCAVFLALRFWTNLARYCLTPWTRRAGFTAAGRVALSFLPLLVVPLAPVIAVSYLAGLIAAGLLGAGTTRALVQAFGTAGGRPRIDLAATPGRWAGWFPGAAVRNPSERISLAVSGETEPRSFWRRPAELGAGMSGVASVRLLGMVFFGVLAARWPATAVAQLVAHAAASTARMGNAPAGSTGQWVGGTVTALLLWAVAGWAAARVGTCPPAVAACARAQRQRLAGTTAVSGTPPFTATWRRLGYRARTLLPTLLAALLISAGVAAVLFEPIGAALGSLSDHRAAGRRLGFLLGTAGLFAIAVRITLLAMVRDWTTIDHRRWLDSRFYGPVESGAGFSAVPVETADS